MGATWDSGDQMPRFIAEGIWENGYEDQFSDLVRRMKPGDRIAIKASFVQKHRLPFDVGGKPVSVMKAKELVMNLAWWSEHPSQLPLLLLTAVVTHLLMSFAQTLMHYGLGHRRLGGIFFRNHIHFHHVHYSKDHLVSLMYIKNDGDGNNTPFFLIPVALMISSAYFIFPLDVFLIQIITAFASFSAHVYLDNQYHIAASPLLRFAWFRRKQQLHFVHHTHGNSNFAIIDNFWDRLLGTYREPDADDAENPPPDRSLGRSSRDFPRPHNLLDARAAAERAVD